MINIKKFLLLMILASSGSIFSLDVNVEEARNKLAELEGVLESLNNPTTPMGMSNAQSIALGGQSPVPAVEAAIDYYRKVIENVYLGDNMPYALTTDKLALLDNGKVIGVDETINGDGTRTYSGVLLQEGGTGGLYPRLNLEFYYNAAIDKYCTKPYNDVCIEELF